MSNGDLEQRLALLERQQKIAETYSIRSFWKALDRSYSIALQTRSLQCIICGFEGSRRDYEVLTSECMFGGGELERYQCPNCDCVFGPQKYLDLDEAFVSLDYELLYSRYSESDSIENETRTFESLRPQSGGLFLDWGCGGAWSSTVSSLRDRGYDVWGYEPSADVSSQFVVNSRDQISARFDGIFSNNVIEHFRDPLAQFREFHDLLKPGGKMAHSSPCYRYEYAFTRFHTLFLLGRSPEVLAQATGFRVSDQIVDGQYINTIFERL
ncbi:class I SAM-dependent methyltransferase [Fulvimarina endophytica]|uniref:Class I SAM-dependent methyltransferase n=1 Tax=Fulvimarina endophytica TaxID=2293836 RepID=A0A371X2X8_9HYPH|nr:class I SAM-dependent methyltransferase [Fulvimarina endophytica]RFC63577.1 class I SAM-dependent methyltransferase [Fulvimarina endophytica]